MNAILFYWVFNVFNAVRRWSRELSPKKMTETLVHVEYENECRPAWQFAFSNIKGVSEAKLVGTSARSVPLKSRLFWRSISAFFLAAFRIFAKRAKCMALKTTMKMAAEL